MKLIYSKRGSRKTFSLFRHLTENPSSVLVCHSASSAKAKHEDFLNFLYDYVFESREKAKGYFEVEIKNRIVTINQLKACHIKHGLKFSEIRVLIDDADMLLQSLVEPYKIDYITMTKEDEKN